MFSLLFTFTAKAEIDLLLAPLAVANKMIEI